VSFVRLFALLRVDSTVANMVFGMRKRGDQDDITPYVIGYDVETTGVETLNTLKYWEQQHKLDPNLPIEDLEEIDGVLAEGNCEKGIEVEAALLEDNSPYPEVRLMDPHVLRR
jgi:hypothetical protein